MLLLMTMDQIFDLVQALTHLGIRNDVLGSSRSFQLSYSDISELSAVLSTRYIWR